VAAEAPILAGRALQRAEAAMAARKRPDAGFDRKTARAELDELVRRAGEMSA
jgi:beta-N-acetylhexosaminidase